MSSSVKGRDSTDKKVQSQCQTRLQSGQEVSVSDDGTGTREA